MASVAAPTTHESAKREWRTRRAALFRQVLAPPPRLSASEWADRYRFLSRESSAEPGKWRTDRAPYLRGILDVFSDPMIERVVMMSSAQVGKTEILNNVVGYFIDQDPAPILVMQPTLEMGEAWSKDRLAPMLRDTPKLRGRIKDPRARDSGNTLLHKTFAGGQLTVTGANSPSSLAARPIRIVLIDELDRAPASAGTEGDPAALAERRSTTFWNRKIGHFSTPTIKGLSRIEQGWAESDQRRYHVPCPHCGHFQHLTWRGLAWDKQSLPDGSIAHLSETAHYVCEACAAVIEESDKRSMLAGGAWVAGQPGRRIAGFHLNALYSPWARWESLVREWLEVESIPERLKVFVNTVLGESWEERGDQVDASTLTGRCEAYAAECPRGVGLLTAAVDVQGDRLEFLVKGWGGAQESWLIDHQVFWGDPGQSEVWEALDLAWRKRYAHESGQTLPVRVMVIDSGGHHTDAVYSWVRPRQRRGVFAIAGRAKPGAAIWPRTPSKANKYGVKLFQVGTDTAKDVVFSRLRRTAPGATYMHFPEGTSDEYFAQLTGEKKMRRLVHGRPVYQYVKTRPRNEALDLEVYNLAALQSLGRAVFDNLSRYAAQLEAPATRDAPAPRDTTTDTARAPQPPPLEGSGPRGRAGRGGWMERWR